MGKLAEGKEYVSGVISLEAKEYIKQLSKENKWSVSQTTGELLEEIIAIRKSKALEKSA